MILDTIKPYLLAAAGAAWIASCVGLWIYKGNIDETAMKAALEEEQNNELQSYVNIDKFYQEQSRVAATQAKQDQYAYQKQLADATARASDASMESLQLQHALSMYADGGWFKAPGADSACIPVSEANSRLGLLAHDAGVLDADGLRASQGAAACAVRLTACERWSDTIESEFGVKP
jgi:hypothetical protein